MTRNCQVSCNVLVRRLGEKGNSAIETQENDVKYVHIKHKHIDVVLVSPFPSAFIVDFELMNVCWELQRFTDRRL